MSDELDVFAQPAAEAKPQDAAKQQIPAQPQQKKQHKKGRGQQRKQQPKANNSPIRGSDGSESVNPLLNAPLPKEQRVEESAPAANPNRRADLPEYRLADIQIWPAQEIVDKMTFEGFKW